MDPKEIIEWGRGIFALILFAISLYAWFRRRQNALIIVSVAFLLFFAKTILDLFLPQIVDEFVRDSIDFVALALFFVAITVRPRKDFGKETA